MFAVRCTQKLLSRGALKTLLEPCPPTTVLGDWYANVLVTSPEHLVVCMSERALLPVVVTAKDVKRLPQRVAQAVADMLRAIGVPEVDVLAEIAEMKTRYLAKTADRRALGSLNDFMFHLESGTGSDRNLSYQERAMRLATIPCSPLSYAYPKEAALAAFVARNAVAAAKSAASQETPRK